MKILGLDASTSTIGIALLSWDGYQAITLDHLSYYKPPKKGELFERLSITKKFVKDKIKEFSPDLICLEDRILSLPGRTSTQTIATLSAFNRIIGLTCYEAIPTYPALIHPISVRNAIKLNGVFPDKLDVPSFMEKHLNIKFPYIYNKNKKLKEENYDMADAIAVGLAWILIEKRKQAELLAKLAKVANKKKVSLEKAKTVKNSKKK